MLENFDSALNEKKVHAPIYTKFKHADITIKTDSPEKLQSTNWEIWVLLQL